MICISSEFLSRAEKSVFIQHHFQIVFLIINKRFRKIINAQAHTATDIHTNPIRNYGIFSCQHTTDR
ncbi:hypothetical protein D3C80_1674730 [compost metagenome]